MATCEVNISDPATLTRSEAEIKLTGTDEDLRVSVPVPNARDTSVALLIDTWVSLDNGATWVHRHREEWRGGEIEAHTTLTRSPMPTVVGMNVPRRASVRVSVGRA